jgi:hypothetical protein
MLLLSSSLETRLRGLLVKPLSGSSLQLLVAKDRSCGAPLVKKSHEKQLQHKYQIAHTDLLDFLEEEPLPLVRRGVFLWYTNFCSQCVQFTDWPLEGVSALRATHEPLMSYFSFIMSPSGFRKMLFITKKCRLFP